MAGLSQDLESTLREMVVRGQLPPGSRINEVHLAKQLAVSRTPLREALTRLAGESFLEAKPRRGFFVRPVSGDELASLYQIRQRLDPWALSVAGLPSAAHLEELHALNRRIAAATEPGVVIELDDQWHLSLLRECQNGVLLDLIRQMMWRTRRYEYVYFQDTTHVGDAVEQHEAILAALADGDLEAGCRELKENMTAAVEPIASWLAQHREANR